jgi:hypothetical protein
LVGAQQVDRNLILFLRSLTLTVSCPNYGARTSCLDNEHRDLKKRPESRPKQRTEDAAPEDHPGPRSAIADSDVGRITFTAAGGAALAAILHLVRLMAAELVLARGSDIALFEQAVRTKLGDFTSPTTNEEARQAGLAHARHLVEHVLTQIRAQAELKRSLMVGNEKEPELPAQPASKLLN